MSDFSLLQRKTVSGAVAALSLVAMMACAPASFAQERARDFGIPFDGVAGINNAITDVPGVEVGHTTLIRGDGPGKIGEAPVRTGVTVIHPLGKDAINGVAAGRAVINGTGEFTGMALVDEVGGFFGPVALTGSGNVGLVHQSLQDWSVENGVVPAEALVTRVLPVVGETLDMRLNDVFGHPMSKADVFAALNSAKGGPVEEGNVGGGTGMIAYTFKGGIGTASRVVSSADQRYTVGVLVQANHGNRDELRIAGLPVGRMIDGAWPSQKGVVVFGPDAGKTVAMPEKNSLLIVIATDAPLQAHQLERLARRASLGLGRTGSTAGNLSGEFSLAFSTTNILSIDGSPAMQAAPISDLDDEVMNSLFAATVQAVEEALANQLVASETMTGVDDVTVYGLPHNQLADIFRGAR